MRPRHEASGEAQQRLIAYHMDVTAFVVEEIDTLMSGLVATRRG